MDHSVILNRVIAAPDLYKYRHIISRQWPHWQVHKTEIANYPPQHGHPQLVRGWFDAIWRRYWNYIQCIVSMRIVYRGINVILVTLFKNVFMYQYVLHATCSNQTTLYVIFNSTSKFLFAIFYYNTQLLVLFRHCNQLQMLWFWKMLYPIENHWFVNINKPFS